MKLFISLKTSIKRIISILYLTKIYFIKYFCYTIYYNI